MTSISTHTMQQFAHVCLHAKKPEEIAVPLTRLLDGVGIVHWYAGTLVHESQLERKGWGFFGMPLGWREHYADQRFSECDDVFQYAKHSALPSTWEHIHARADAKRRKLKLRARAVREEAKSYGLHDGYIRSVHESGELPAAVTLGGADFDKSPNGLARLDMLAAFAFEGFRRYSEGFKVISPHLSKREREVLCWTADGKSAWDIGEILRLKEDTVRDYQKRLRTKYGCSSMTRVVAIATLNRTITTLPSLGRA